MPIRKLVDNYWFSIMKAGTFVCDEAGNRKEPRADKKQPKGSMGWKILHE